MQSIRVTLFSAFSKPRIVISVPIVNQEHLIQRVEDLATRYKSVTHYLDEKNHVNCRDLFQEESKPELFFFPSATGSCISLQLLSFGEFFFLRHASYGFIFCFSPNIKTKFFTQKAVTSFSEAEGYPPKASEASPFFFSSSHISILVSEHGCMTLNNDGEWMLLGIEIAFLQKKRFLGKSAFVQRKNECISPHRSLSEDVGLVNPFPRHKKYITVRCVCHEPGFCYLAQFPVLSEQELEQKIIRDQENRRQKYAASSHLYMSKPLERSLLQVPKSKHFVIFPHGMGIDVPFGYAKGGELFFSYADKTLSGYSRKEMKLIFFPPLFNSDKRLQICANKNMKDILKKEKETAVSFCGSKKATIFASSRIKLVSCSLSEYKLDGAKVEIISTKSHGGWAVCFFCETINLASSPLPGPSGIGRRKSTTQATATVSVPPERQGKQTQKRKNSSSVSSGIESRASTTKTAATVFVPPERESPQTQQESRSSLSGPSGGVSFRPYGSQHPYGPLPFYGGLYSYRSPIIPHPQAAFTVSVSPESESTQTQQEGRSSPSGVEHRKATASLSHAEATVVVPSEEQRQQTQQRSRNPLPDSSGVRHQLICPIPFRVQPAASAFMQFEQTQQRRSSPVPEPSGVSFHSYPQHEPWPFSEGPSLYFYPEIGSFFGGFYSYGSPLPPCPYPLARQGQWMPAFPPPFSAVRPFVAAFNPLRYEIPVQERGVGNSARAEEASAAVPVGAVQQTSIWRPYEEPSNAEVPPQDQADNTDEDK